MQSEAGLKNIIIFLPSYLFNIIYITPALDKLKGFLVLQHNKCGFSGFFLRKTRASGIQT